MTNTNKGNMAAAESSDTAGRIINGDALRKRGRDLADQCNNFRATLRKLTERRQQARARLGESVGAFLRGVGPVVSDAQLRRDYLKASQQERADRAEGRSTPPAEIIPGPSYEDRSRAWRGDSETWARKQHKHGGNSRGAYPASLRGAKAR